VAQSVNFLQIVSEKRNPIQNDRINEEVNQLYDLPRGGFRFWKER